MSSQTTSALLLATTAVSLALGTPAAASGQEVPPASRAWQVGLWITAGYQLPSGRMASHAASDNPTFRLLETLSELNPSMMAGGGIEVRFPAHDLGVRLGWESTVEAEATGRIAVCSLVEGRLCQPEVAPVTVRTLTSVVRVVAGNPEGAIRPVISGGVGLRRFTYVVSECPGLADDDATLVCNAITDLYRDPIAHGFLHAGLGLQATANRMVFELGGSGSTGRYRGGTGRTNGNWYHVLRVQLSTSVMIL